MQTTINGRMTNKQLVEEAKQLAATGYLQEAIDLVSDISNPSVQEWRNKLKVRLAQQNAAKRANSSRKQQAFLLIAVLFIILMIVSAVIIFSNKPNTVDAKSVNYTVLVTNTPTPDLKATEDQIVDSTQSAIIMVTAESIVHDAKATSIAQGTPTR